MIRRHDFNSEWWGDEVGIVPDAAFFDLTPKDRFAQLQEFVWVEFAQPISQLPSRRVLADAGFFYADTHLRFRLDMRNVECSSSACRLEVRSAAELPFEIHATDIRPFLNERFYVLPGATEVRVTARYHRWASRLISQHPATCLCLSLENEVQGWFLTQPEKAGLQLTLAMLNVRAKISGLELYARSLAHLSEIGYSLGFASFSARNTNVLNIYSRLGARFLEPRECWMCIPGKCR